MLYLVALDKGISTFTDYNIKGMANSVIINKEGDIVWRGHPDYSVMKQAIDALLD
jgi:hypothetical protein